MEEAKYADKHEEVFVATETTVDQWFSFWIENIVGDLAPNTLRNYRERYSKTFSPLSVEWRLPMSSPCTVSKS